MAGSVKFAGQSALIHRWLTVKMRYTICMSTTLRNVLFVIIGLLVIIILILSWFFLKPILFKPSQTATSTPLAATSTPVTTSGPAPAAHITAGNQYYTADMQYPSSTPLATSAGTQADANAVQIIKTATQLAITTFVQDADLTNPPQGERDSMQGQKYSLSSTYKLYTGPGTISYVYTINEDTLGAHPNSSYATFTFDSQTGQQVPLYDLFNSGADYLDILSTTARTILTAQLGSAADPSFIDPGTTADNTNFQDFALDGTNLDFFFAPYEVAPYSSGEQIVKIPLNQLSSVLKPHYQ
jgi:hypothetical protein